MAGSCPAGHRQLSPENRQLHAGARLGLDLGFKKELDGQAKLFELAQQLGCTRAVTTVQPASDQRPYHEELRYAPPSLRGIGRRAGRSCIRLAVGLSTDARLREGRAFQFIQGVDAFLMLFRSIDSANVGMALDLWHWHLGAARSTRSARWGTRSSPWAWPTPIPA